MSRLAVNVELLRTDAMRLLRAQPGWLGLGLAGPLGITLYTLLRPWAVQRVERDLLQAALFLAAWNIVFVIIYAISSWLRPKQDSTERELLHLPLSRAHFALRRMLETSLVPLTVALLALPLWGVLLIYAGVPYGVDGDSTRWSWVGWQELANPWSVRMLWVLGCILSAALLAAALATWLNELVPLRWLRCILILAVPIGMYVVVRMLAGDYSAAYGGYWVDYGPFLMNYRQTRGVSPLPYLTLLSLLLVGPLLVGWLRPFWCWLLLSLPLLLVAAFFLRGAVPQKLHHAVRPVVSVVFGRDTRYAIGLYAGHLSPPQNIRLLWRSYPSNVLFAGRELLVEPDYPHWEFDREYPQEQSYVKPAEYAAAIAEYERQREQYQAEFDARFAVWQEQRRAYDELYSQAPRLPLWVMAGMYPLLLPLWAVAGLLLGISLRRDPPRD